MAGLFQRTLLASLIGSSAIVGPAQGQYADVPQIVIPPTWKCEPFGGWPGLSARIPYRVPDWRVYRNKAAIEEIKRRVLAATLERCPEANFIMFRLIDKSLGTFEVFYDNRWERRTQSWVSEVSQIDNLVEKDGERAAAEAKEAAKKQEETAKAAAKVALQQKIKSELKIEVWASQNALKSNVFVYQGKVVGVHATFDQMIAATVARFGQILATDVPTAQFTQTGQEVILAIKMAGLKETKFLGTDVSLPYGSYVGVYKCRERGCSEFFN